MFEIKLLEEKKQVAGEDVNNVVGGFVEGKPAILIDDVATIHKVTVKHLSESVRKLIKDGTLNDGDVIDLMKVDEKLAKEIINANNLANNKRRTRRTDMFLFSEKGYLKIIMTLRFNKNSKIDFNDVVENYFTMKEHLTNISIVDPDTFIETLPKMSYYTCNKYFANIISVKNIDEVVPALIAKFKSLSHLDNAGGMSASNKCRLISCCANIIDKMKENPDLKVYDVAKLDDYQIQLLNYRHSVIASSNAGYKTQYDKAKKELTDTKELLNKAIEEKSIIEKPIVNEENYYEDLLRSFKVYRNYLAKVWDESMEEVCNTYYDRIPVKLPTAMECIKMNYKNKFEYCYAYYPEDTKRMVNMMYKDCISNGYLDR